MKSTSPAAKSDGALTLFHAQYAYYTDICCTVHRVQLACIVSSFIFYHFAHAGWKAVHLITPCMQ